MRVFCQNRFSLRAWFCWLSKFTVNVFLFLMLFASSLALDTSAYANPPQISDNQLKAVFIYNFMHFITWPEPEESSTDSEEPTIVVIGNSPLAKALEDLQNSLKKAGRKAFTVKDFKQFNPTHDIKNATIIFIGNSEKKHHSEINSQVQQLPILTVAEFDSFLENGGMIQLKEKAGKIRYKISKDALRSKNFRPHSQLLKSSL